MRGLSHCVPHSENFDEYLHDYAYYTSFYIKLFQSNSHENIFYASIHIDSSIFERI